MTLKGGTTHACAACKYQRRRCTPKCLLAPYFPADQPKMFQNAHRLFGVSNIVKILKGIDPSQKREAMNSIIFQANMRDRYPVEGCCYFIRGLQSQIHQTEMELHAVHSQLRLYRQQQQQQTHMQDGSTIIDECTSNLQLGINALTLYHEQADVNSLSTPLPVSSNEHYTNTINVAYNDENNSMWIQHAYPQHNFGTETNNINNNSNNTMSNNSVLMMQPLLVSSQHQNIQEEPVQDYDEMHTFFDTIDDKQSYIDSNDTSDSSSDSSLKDTTDSFQHVAKKELKNVAACFSLTSVN
ncbi:LOB domain-containing protein 27-like [Impatiens glandulifera]|uniref:LOB domain-containing protein 27-like n=1 Tax=Impatiens glandulifera TaxID=253017 RepID=UPI001FB0EA87|nr:LOB domain-containing protein 27-like [Impatiens glandulifera]